MGLGEMGLGEMGQNRQVTPFHVGALNLQDPKMADQKRTKTEKNWAGK